MGRHTATEPVRATVLAPLVIDCEWPAPRKLSVFMSREGSQTSTMFARWDGSAWSFSSPLLSQFGIEPTDAELALAEETKRKHLRA